MYLPAYHNALNPEESNEIEGDDRHWLILYPEDYDNFMKDGEGNLFVLVDDEQAAEVERLAKGIQEGSGQGDKEEP